MPKLDKLKEELGWLKVVCGIFIATNLSLIAWLAQKYTTQGVYLNILNGVAIILVTIAVIYINKTAYEKIDEIGDIE